MGKRAILSTWLARCEATGAVVPHHFIQHTDLLYSATWRAGGELLVYFLFEHLSAPPKKDSLLAFRLLRYQVRIWEDWLARHPDAKSLPMIIPIVMYHGATPWSEPRRFDALLDVPASVRPACGQRSPRTWSSSRTCSTTSRRCPTTSYAAARC